MRLHPLLSLAALAGCYRPGIEPCVYHCNGNTCPSGLECNSDQWCAETAASTCSGVTMDAPGPCDWAPSNIDACARGFDQITANWNIPMAETLAIDTDSPSSVPVGVMKMMMDQVGVRIDPALVLAVHDLNIAGRLDIRGSLPLIILASGDVTISGTVNVVPTADSGSTCIGKMGGTGTNTIDGGGGGGGGSLGDDGADGGFGGQQSGGTGAAAQGGGPGTKFGLLELTLTPISMGCRGGHGGKAATISGGLGGPGGGALQISARGAMVIDGSTISVNGGGGGSAQNAAAGAGGGGSGGALLLEAKTVSVASVRACANGGGGAAGGSTTQPGGVSDCVSAAMGGNPGMITDSGGNGQTGSLAPTDGRSGAGTVSPAIGHGGGGGGGSVGRIRIRGTVTGTGQFSPPFAP